MANVIKIFKKREKCKTSNCRTVSLTNNRCCNVQQYIYNNQQWVKRLNSHNTYMGFQSTRYNCLTWMRSTCMTYALISIGFSKAHERDLHKRQLNMHGRVQSGGPDPPPPPLKNHKNIGFLTNTGPDPLKNHKATQPALNGGPSSARQ